jgi:hypothetical protein
MTALWHYTCGHGWQGIQGAGEIQPHMGWVWLTDLSPDSLAPARLRKALGLTSTILKCDRMEHALRVEAPAAVSWRSLTRLARAQGDRRFVTWARDLERAHGARPSNWFLSSVAVPLSSEAVA